MAIPGPLGLLRVAVPARPLDDGKRFRIDLRLTKDGLVGSGNAGRPEGMDQRAAHAGEGGCPNGHENLFEH